MLLKGRSKFDYSKARAKLDAARIADAPLYKALEEKRAHACAICGRPLTDPDSIARGVGPECAGKAGQAIDLDEEAEGDD